jgi:hypothetical protein
MLQFAIVVYGLLLSFVLSSTARNRREGRAHAPMLVYVGYVLCGLSAGAAVALPVVAGMGVDLAPLVA